MYKRSRSSLSFLDYQALCRKVYHRDGWRCRVCRKRKTLTAHHIVFRSHGGKDVDSNMITLCTTCHDGVHKLNPTTGAKLVLLPQVEGDPIDANKPVSFMMVNGWKP